MQGAGQLTRTLSVPSTSIKLALVKQGLQKWLDEDMCGRAERNRVQPRGTEAGQVSWVQSVGGSDSAC